MLQGALRDSRDPGLAGNINDYQYIEPANFLQAARAHLPASLILCSIPVFGCIKFNDLGNTYSWFLVDLMSSQCRQQPKGPKSLASVWPAMTDPVPIRNSRIMTRTRGGCKWLLNIYLWTSPSPVDLSGLLFQTGLSSAFATRSVSSADGEPSRIFFAIVSLATWKLWMNAWLTSPALTSWSWQFPGLEGQNHLLRWQLGQVRG